MAFKVRAQGNRALVDPKKKKQISDITKKNAKQNAKKKGLLK